MYIYYYSYGKGSIYNVHQGLQHLLGTHWHNVNQRHAQSTLIGREKYMTMLFY